MRNRAQNEEPLNRLASFGLGIGEIVFMPAGHGHMTTAGSFELGQDS
jgi:hypothetical protein